VFGEIMTKLRVLLYNDSALIQPRAWLWTLSCS